MKLDKIYSLLRKSVSLTLFKDNNSQYLCNGACIFALDKNFPILSSNTVPILIGSSEEIDVKEAEVTDFIKRVMNEQVQPSDKHLQVEEYDFFDLAFLSTDDENTLFVNECYLTPFKNDDSIDYRLRNVDDKQFVVVFQGFFIIAAIMPVQFSPKSLESHLELTRKVYKSLEYYYRELGE